MKFLSEEWVEALDAKLRESDVRLSPDPEVDGLCVQNIAELGDGEAPLCYFIRVDAEGATAAFGEASDPSVVFTQPYDVAVSIAQRQRDAHAAFLLGEIKVAGDVTALLQLGDITAKIQELVESLHGITEF